MSAGSTDVSALEAKGRELFNAMVQAARLRGRQYRPLPEISRAGGGYQTSIYNPNPVGFGRNVEMMLGAVDVPRDGYVAVGMYNAPEGDAGEPPYLNHVHREGKAILCWFNFAELDALSEGRMFWSELMAVGCSRAMAAVNAASPGPLGDATGSSPLLDGAASSHTRSSMANLAAIFRLTIVNETTVGLVHQLGRLNPPEELLTLRAGEAEFFALLGTPNGTGPARMLASYPEMFGRKVITSALVDVRGDPNICWVLEEVEDEPAPPPPLEPKTPPSLSRRGRR